MSDECFAIYYDGHPIKFWHERYRTGGPKGAYIQNPNTVEYQLSVMSNVFKSKFWIYPTIAGAKIGLGTLKSAAKHSVHYMVPETIIDSSKFTIVRYISKNVVVC